MQINLGVGWVAILVGLLLGALIGTFFHREDWLGGYSSWPRRMLRLTHISLLGTGLLNVSFSLSADALNLAPPPRVASILFIVGAATMPSVCALSAWRPKFRHLFFIPVVCLLMAAADLVYRGLWP